MRKHWGQAEWDAYFEGRRDQAGTEDPRLQPPDLDPFYEHYLKGVYSNEATEAPLPPPPAKRHTRLWHWLND